MAGFADEPQRGDGFSVRRSKEIFKKDKYFKEWTPEEAAAKSRLIDFKRWTEGDNRKQKFPTDKAKLLETPERIGKEPFCQKYKDGELIAWMSGWWAVLLDLMDKDGKPFTCPHWQLSVLVGEHYKTSASMIRKGIIKNFDEATYEEWKKLVSEDVESRRQVLDSAADWLGHKKTVAISYTSSPSSERLLKSHGIRVEREWAFIYPHYKGNFYPREDD